MEILILSDAYGALKVPQLFCTLKFIGYVPLRVKSRLTISPFVEQLCLRLTHSVLFVYIYSIVLHYIHHYRRERCLLNPASTSDTEKSMLTPLSG